MEVCTQVFLSAVKESSKTAVCHLVSKDYQADFRTQETEVSFEQYFYSSNLLWAIKSVECHISLQGKH